MRMIFFFILLFEFTFDEIGFEVFKDFLDIF